MPPLQSLANSEAKEEELTPPLNTHTWWETGGRREPRKQRLRRRECARGDGGGHSRREREPSPEGMTSPAPGHSTLQRRAGPGATAWASARQATGTATGKARQGTDGDSLPHADGETSPAPCPRTTPVRSSPKVRGSRPRARPPPGASAPAERGCSASAGHRVALAVRAGGPGAFVCVAAGRERARTALQSWALHHHQHLDLGHMGGGGAAGQTPSTKTRGCM